MADSAAEDLSQWTKVIVPQRGLFEIPWRELWNYRDLIRQLVIRDFTATYKQTLLGPLWFVIQPVLTTVAFSFLFGRMGRLGTDNLPHFVFYLAGLTPWTYFAECVSRTSHTFTRNAQVFGKVYFPRLAVPISTLIANLVGFGVRLTILVLGILFYLWQDGRLVDAALTAHTAIPRLSGIDPNWRIALLPLLVLDMAMLAMGVGCIVSALTTRFRDLSVGIGFAVQLWMFASCIIFPLSRIELGDRWVFLLNPMVPVIEGFRFAFLGEGVVEKWHLAMSFGISSLMLLIGVVLFNRASQNVMDTV